MVEATNIHQHTSVRVTCVLMAGRWDSWTTVTTGTAGSAGETILPWSKRLLVKAALTATGTH